MWSRSAVAYFFVILCLRDPVCTAPAAESIPGSNACLSTSLCVSASSHSPVFILYTRLLSGGVKGERNLLTDWPSKLYPLVQDGYESKAGHVCTHCPVCLRALVITMLRPFVCQLSVGQTQGGGRPLVVAVATALLALKGLRIQVRNKYLLHSGIKSRVPRSLKRFN